ncbi:MAG: MmcQ/YjbR family DNA-binding protein [Angustibacter sp.]
MTLEEVARHAESLSRVKRKGTPARPAWYVDDRLVVRLDRPGTVVIRVPLTDREALLDRYPDTFGVPPRMEAHHKVEAYLDGADPAAVRTAIDLAWRLQAGEQQPGGA